MFEFLKKYTDSQKGKKQASLENTEVKKIENKASGIGVTIESQVPLQPIASPVTATARASNQPSTGAGLTIKPIDSNPMTTPETAAKPKEDKPEEIKSASNVFTDLFPAKDKTKTDDQLVNSLNASTKTNSILKPKKSDAELLIYKKPVLGANLLKLTVLIILLTFSYFYTQLHPTFNLLGDQNPVQKNVYAYERVLDLQSKINKQNYILAKYALDDFVYTTDSYLYKTSLYSSSLISQKDKAQLEKEFPTLRAKMREDLILANDLLSYKKVPDKLPVNPTESGNLEQAFKKALKDEIRLSITDNKNPEETDFLRTVSKLADNETINAALGKYKIPTMTDVEFAEMLSLLSESNTSNFGTLSSLRQKRVKWSAIIEEIEGITKSIDPLFGSKLMQDGVGEIFYSSFTLDQAKNQITVIGETLSDDGKNFSLSADLLDAFEKSSMFQNVKMDSFTKSKEQETSYKGVLSIDLTLEQ